MSVTSAEDRGADTDDESLDAAAERTKDDHSHEHDFDTFGYEDALKLLNEEALSEFYQLYCGALT